jgi:predicted RNA-binding protein YlxR (DUF448 family)
MKPNYRRCVSCRKVSPKEDFWRVVRVYPSHQVQLGQGMGRSAYLCPEATCLQAAQKKNRLGKALRSKVPPELYQTLWEKLPLMSSTEQTQDPNDNPRENLKLAALTQQQ